MKRVGAGEARGRGVDDAECLQSTPSDIPQRLLQRVTMTTENLPAQRQFSFWRASMAAHLDLSRPNNSPEDAFPASATSWRFGPLMLSQTRLPPCNYRRSAAQIRRDSLDHWIIAIIRRGVQRQRGEGPDFEMQRGVAYVFSMAEAYEAERTGTEIELLTLYVPRDAAVDCERHLAALRNRPLDGALGTLLADHLAALVGCMPQLEAGDGARLATATLALIAAAALHHAEPGVPDGPQMAELQLARIKRIVRQNLGAATFGPARLCVEAGISRSQLYRLLEPSGGVARYIQRERLRMAYRRLADPAERRNVARIAEGVGFFEPSTFSRAFRTEFGFTPREVRMVAMESSLPEWRAGQADGDRAYAAMLRDL